ncbi:hypothetical protein BJ166DRAFT_588440 [Pestalotiopsis sp. NC0098]|nr:hypothetical protein BJ166DRAFT_588440 [Pestalotiopsis sp. NC0098]
MPRMWSIEMHMKQEEIIVKCGSHSRPLLLGRGSRRTAPRRHAVVGLTKVAAYEGAARCLRVNPDSKSGFVDTDLIRQPSIMPNGDGWTVILDDNLSSIIKRRAKPEEVAASIAFLLGDESRMVTRQGWRVDGG